MPEPATAMPAPMRAFWGLSSDSLPARERFDAWHAALSAFNDICVAPDHRPSFRASTTYWAFGSLTLSVNTATPLALVRSEAAAAREGLEHAVVVVADAGQFLSHARGETHSLAPGQLLWGNLRSGYDFRLDPATGGRWLDLSCPPGAAARLDELGSGRTPLGRDDTPRARLLARFVKALSRQAPRLTAADAPAMEQALLSVIAAARTDPSGGPARLSAMAEHAVARARAAYLIEQELFSARLTVERVSDLTRIPRTSLYRLFAAEDGVANYIRTRRLESLRADLADPAKRRLGVAQLAEARGFHCLSTLNRAFRERYGCAPSELRGKAAANGPQPVPAGIGAVLDFLRQQQVG